MPPSDKLSTTWDYAPHTRAKHRILRAYLDAWFPILASIKKAERVLFVDGFAGPGEYSGGEEGSPTIAIRAALEHKARFAVPVRLVFIEVDPERHQHLCGVIERLRAKAGSATNEVEVVEPIIRGKEHSTYHRVTVSKSWQKNTSVPSESEQEPSMFGVSPCIARNDN